MKDAIQQALEALIAIRTQYESLLDSDYATRSNPDPASREPSIAQATAAIAACRAALAQPDDAPKDDKTGRPPPPLMQDDHKGLSQALSRDPNARQLVRDAAAQIADDAQDGKLWAVNVHGPDDLYAMASEADALARANELNVYFGTLEYHEYDPIMRAVAIEWPHTAESHAASLAKAAAIAAQGEA